MSNNPENGEVAKLAHQQGACFYFQKPLSIEIFKGLRQQMGKETMINTEDIYGEVKINAVEVIFENKSRKETYHEYNKVAINKKEEIEQQVNGNVNSESYIKKKSYTHWNKELHKKFMAASYQLGKNNCFPKDILELMNEPDLTRMQVASHLQKCRDGLWHGTKSKRTIIPKGPATKLRKRKYGALPYLEMPSNITQQAQPQENQTSPKVNELPSFTNSFEEDNGFGAPLNMSVPSFNNQQPKMDDFLSFPSDSDLSFLNTQGGRGV